jgi:molybdate transport system substrate-binding protein
MPALCRIVIGGVALSALMLLAAATTAPVRAEYVIAPDVVVFCEPTLQHAVADAARLWRRQTGIPVRIFSAPTALLLEEISHHIRSDLVIAEGEDTAALAVQRKLIKPETRIGAWRNRLMVARRDAVSEPLAPLTPRALAALFGTAPIAIVDAPVARAGRDSRKALETLGLWDAVQGQTVGVVDTADASFLLADGKVRFAIVYATDLAANPDFSGGSLPDDAYQPILYWMAETSTLLSPNAVEFAAFLRQPPAQQRLRADGLEILP